MLTVMFMPHQDFVIRLLTIVVFSSWTLQGLCKDTYHDGILVITCKKDKITLPDIKQPASIHPHTIVFNNCSGLVSSYSDIASRFEARDSKLEILKLYFKRSNQPVRLDEKHFKHLHIRELLIEFHDTTNFERSLLFLKAIKLNTLTLSNALLGSMPKVSALKELALSRGASKGQFGDCKYLRKLELRAWEVRVDKWLAHCPLLNQTILQDMTPTSVIRAVKGMKFVTDLKIKNCQLQNKHLLEIPFEEMESLQELDLGANELDFPIFYTQILNLRVLKLGNNPLKHSYRAGWLYEHTSLKEIYFDHNSFEDICQVDMRNVVDFARTDNCYRRCTELHPQPKSISLCDKDGDQTLEEHPQDFYTETLIVSNCAKPTSYRDTAISNGVVDVLQLQVLSLVNLETRTAQLEPEHFEGLSITELYIKYGELSFFDARPLSFLESLPDLTFLSIWYGTLPLIPKNSNLTGVIFSNGASEDEFGGCNYLTQLLLMKWEVHKDNWVAHCPKLTHLALLNMTATSVIRTVNGAVFLTDLVIRGCKLQDRDLEMIVFEDMKALRSLNLKDNDLYVPLFVDSLTSIKVLNLENNHLKQGYRLAWLLRQIPILKELYLGGNPSFDLCYFVTEGDHHFTQNQNFGGLSIEHNYLEIFALNKTNTKRLCFDFNTMNALKFVSLSKNGITDFKFQDLLTLRVPLQVDLHENPITEVEFTKDTFMQLQSREEIDLESMGYGFEDYGIRSSIDILGDIKLDCSCRNAYFAQALEESLVDANITCTNNEEIGHLVKMENKTKECKFPCGKCICQNDWMNNELVADCHGANTSEIPHIEKLTKVLALGNLITTIRINDLPVSLTYLDLTNNRISGVDKDVAMKLFNISGRVVLLSGNPIQCNCNNRGFIHIIQYNKEKVRDYQSLSCVNGTLVHNIIATDLCVARDIWTISLAIIGGLLGLVGLLGSLYYRFVEEINIFLYARGWCTCGKLEREDMSKMYDAFIAFAHDDGAIIAYELVNKLEDMGFRICVHYRDWIPGDLITEQIVRSVEVSRRTIVVLSKNFVESMWGLLEFRTAHAYALKDGVLRVILIIVDDVVEADAIHDDLRGYIRTNTYVRWGDPWFWDKLRYAMPHE